MTTAKQTPSLISENEILRLKKMTAYEQSCYAQGYKTIAGLDEAGRGPLAGPVVAAACIIPHGRLIPKVNDSKKLSPRVRADLFHLLTNDPTIIFAIGIVDSGEIDRINILQATIQAMLQALSKLSIPPDYLLVDGMKFPYTPIPSQMIIKGDQLSQSIAAASIIAKETRDALMNDYHEKWPVYGFNRHKGYGTEFHLEALTKHGPCPIHRNSFAPVKDLSFKSLYRSYR